MMMAQECFQRLPVRFEPVGPEIISHQRARLRDALLEERQRGLRCRRIGEHVYRLVFRLAERLEHGAWEPRMLLDQSAAHADEMHDREYAGAFEVIAGGGGRIGKEPAHVRWVSGQRRRGGPEESGALAV